VATVFLVQAPFDMTEVRKIGTLENVTPAYANNRVLIDSLHKAPVTWSRLTLLYIKD